MSVTWEFTDDPAEFRAAAGAYLAARPVVATIVATVAERAVSGELTPTPGVPFWFAHACDAAGRVVGATMRTAPFLPHPVFVLPMPESAAVELAGALHARGESPGGATGVLPPTRAFADTAAALGGARVETSMETLLFELGELVEPASPCGAARVAEVGDLALVTSWFRAFGRAADEQAGRAGGHDRSAHFSTEEVRTRIRAGRVLLWEDDGVPVCLVGWNPPGFGVARIGPVYTLPEHRRRGYASACTAEASRRLLAAGHRVCLFTDRANPTSHHVYTALGYRPVAEMVELDLV